LEALCIIGRSRCLVGLVPDQGDDHAVEVEKEHDEVETELDEGFLLVSVERPENFGCVEEMCVIEDLLDVKSQQRQVEDQSDPIAVDQKQDSQECVNSGLGNDVGVQAVA